MHCPFFCCEGVLEMVVRRQFARLSSQLMFAFTNPPLAPVVLSPISVKAQPFQATCLTRKLGVLRGVRVQSEKF
jgi:hypothetical protein